MENITEPLLEMRNISKNFGAICALNNVNLSLGHGEILGLAGDNAAGKSTLMKILTGVYKMDQGEIWIDGKKTYIKHPDEARDIGVEMIYQDFALAPNMSIVDNIFLGREITKSLIFAKMINRKKMEKRTLDVLKKIDMKLGSVKTLVNNLSGGQMQAVAIARAITFDAKIIIMDEPTANLSVKAIPHLLSLMEKLKAEGTSIIFITHTLKDLFSVCDRVMVLRQGKSAGNLLTSQTNLDEVTALITGLQTKFSAI